MTRASAAPAGKGRTFLKGRMTEGLDDRGSFDELIGGPVHVHLEMMDDDCLWGSFYKTDSSRSVVIWISAKCGKLRVTVEED